MEEVDVLLTLGRRSEEAATSMAIPEVINLAIESGHHAPTDEGRAILDIPDDRQILEET
jgi:hypothetical protein